MGAKHVSYREREVYAQALTVPCPRCGSGVGKNCRLVLTSGPAYGCAGSPHLGRVKAAGLLDHLPLVAAYVRGELR